MQWRGKWQVINAPVWLPDSWKKLSAQLLQKLSIPCPDNVNVSIVKQMIVL